MRKSVSILIFFLLVTLSCTKGPGISEEGLFDLRAHDFSRRPIVKLTGMAQLYWGELYGPGEFRDGSPEMTGLIKVPSTWNGQVINGTPLSGHGYATYRMVVLLPEASPEQMELEIVELNSSSRIFVNGELRLEMGEPGRSRKESRPEWDNAVLPVDTSTGRLELIIQISNYDFVTGGMGYRPLSIGSGNLLSRNKQRMIIMVTVLFTLLIALGLFNLLFFITAKRGPAYLWLSLLCFCFAMAILTLGEKGLFLLFFSNNFRAVTTLAHFPNRCGLMLLLLFIFTIFPKEVEKRVLYPVVVFFTLSTLVVIFTPARIYSYGMYINIGANFILAIYITFVFIMAFVRGRDGAAIFLAAWFLVLLIIGIEALGVLEFISLPNILPLSVVLFLIFHTIMLSIRFSRALADSEHLAEHLISINNLKDDFLAKTSHEFRTPLHAIMGIAQAMIEGAEGELSPKSRANLEVIIQSSRRLSSLVNDILDFYKIKHSTLCLQQKPINIYSIAGTTISLVRFLYASQKVEVINSIPPALEAVYADEYRIQQIMINILENSLKHTVKGEIRLNAAKRGDYIEITVSDSGSGIPPELQKRVFNMFEQFDGGRGSRGGVGIGLAITKQLVELHGGQISLESIEGRGTTIRFTLPIYTGHEEAIEVASHFSTPSAELTGDALEESSRGTILIVDDEPSNIHVLKNFIVRLGYNCRVVLTGEEAVELVEREGANICLVIMDLMLPGISGYEVCRELRKSFSLYELPILILTAKIRNSDIVAGFDAGANDYITKPFDKGEFLARVKTLLKLYNVIHQNVGLEQASSLKQLFLSMLSHDIRHPLHILKSTIKLLQERRIEEDKVPAILGQLYLETMGLEEMAERFLQLARIENGQTSSIKTSFDPFKAIEELVERSRLKAAGRRQTISLDIKAGKRPPIIADRAQFESIFTNIISNAIKFTPHAQAITIRAGLAGAEQTHFRVDVRDRGPGLSELDELGVFKAFSRLSTGVAGGEPSSGVGLYIVKHLVDLHDGRILFNNNHGVGTTVSIELPLAP